MAGRKTEGGDVSLVASGLVAVILVSNDQRRLLYVPVLLGTLSRPSRRVWENSRKNLFHYSLIMCVDIDSFHSSHLLKYPSPLCAMPICSAKYAFPSHHQRYLEATLPICSATRYILSSSSRHMFQLMPYVSAYLRSVCNSHCFVLNTHTTLVAFGKIESHHFLYQNVVSSGVFDATISCLLVAIIQSR